MTGNPIYPVAFLNWQADPNFHATDWTSIKVFLEPGGIWLMIQALISEYLFWSLAPLLVILISFYSKIKKRKELLKDLIPLVVLVVINFIIFLPQPSLPDAQIVISNMRFVYPVMIPLMLFIFLIAKRLRILKEIAIIALLSSISVLSQLEYRPKLVIVWLIIITIIFIAPQKILKLLNIRKA
jgi:membrane-associated HD superfamily phosphohydrolase